MKNNSENIKINGWVTIEEIGPDGKILDVIEGPNLIVNGGKLNVEQLIAGNASGKPISQMSFGTNGTAPDPTDTAITGPLVKALTDINYLPGNIVEFVTDIDAGDPAMTIQEVGLLNLDGTLCHRKVFSPPKVKVAGLSYHVTYKVKVI